MMDTAAPSRPTRCFCRMTLRELTPWARLRYLEGVPTIRLLQMAQRPAEREAVGLVVLLDVPDEEVIRMLSPLVQTHCDVPACRDHVRAWLRDMLATLSASGGATT